MQTGSVNKSEHKPTFSFRLEEESPNLLKKKVIWGLFLKEAESFLQLYIQLCMHYSHANLVPNAP